MRRRAAFALIAMLLPLAAYASPAEDLAQTTKDLEASRKNQSRLAEQYHRTESELASLQKKLVQSAEGVQQAEAQLTSSEEKQRILKEQVVDKTAKLKERENNLDSLVKASLRLSQTPPEAMVMMPGDTMETMKAARALKMITSGIKDEAASIRAQVAELQVLQDKVARHHDEIIAQKAKLEKDKKTLTAKLAERMALQAKLGKQQEAEAAKASDLAKKAEDLKGLVADLEKTERKNREAVQAAGGHKGKLRSFAEAKGHIRTPAAGRLVKSFGGDHGETSKGIVILARNDAEVVAPYDGEVVFSGPFLNYGRLVIIRHSDDFHTLLAGLAKINTHVGDFLLEGEPIGAMGSKDSENRLYVELRRNNQPVDPKPWISGLNKNSD